MGKDVDPMMLMDAVRLQELLDRMDVPEQRKTDIHWLDQNLRVRNRDHPDFEEAQNLLIKLRR